MSQSDTQQRYVYVGWRVTESNPIGDNEELAALFKSEFKDEESEESANSFEHKKIYGLQQIKSVKSWWNVVQNLPEDSTQTRILKKYVEQEQKKADDKASEKGAKSQRVKMWAYELGPYIPLAKPVDYSGQSCGAQKLSPKELVDIVRDANVKGLKFCDGVQRFATMAVDRLVLQHIIENLKKWELRKGMMTILNGERDVKIYYLYIIYILFIYD